MAEGSDDTTDVGWLIGILVLLGILWLSLGGPNRERSKEGPVLIINPTEEESRGEDAGSDGGGNSRYGGKITLDEGNAESDDRRNEYLILKAKDNIGEPINISGWTIKSPATGISAVIPKGTLLPRSGGVNATSDIFLKGGERAVLSSGLSPIGVSFKTNICTGYFEQYQNFTPSLPRDCPLPEDESLANFGLTIQNLGSDNYDACIEFLEDIPRCEFVSTRDPGFPECRKVRFEESPPDECFEFDECRDFVSSFINYNGCVELHKKGSDFIGDEWRIFLRANDELWREEGEVIMLFDEFGEIVDVVSY